MTEQEEIVGSRNLEKEAERLLPCLKGYVVVLDKDGREMDSEALSRHVEKVKLTAGEMTFVIGSSNGLDVSVKRRADLLLSFGKITLPHSLARVVLVEQLYRAATIAAGGKYHK